MTHCHNMCRCRCIVGDSWCLPMKWSVVLFYIYGKNSYDSLHVCSHDARDFPLKPFLSSLYTVLSYPVPESGESGSAAISFKRI